MLATGHNTDRYRRVTRLQRLTMAAEPQWELLLGTGRGGRRRVAGSPRAMIARGGEILPVHLDQQLPLGMFGDIRYETQRFRLQPDGGQDPDDDAVTLCLDWRRLDYMGNRVRRTASPVG